MTAAMAARLKETILLQRMGQPREIAALVSYVAGEAASHMTEASLTIGGGFVPSRSSQHLTAPPDV